MTTWNERIDNIQTRLANLVSEEFAGANYYNTQITCSSYNPTIDTDITVTITLTNANGDAVEDAQVPVTASAGTFKKLNDSNITASASVTGTTNSSGQFSLTYNCSEWGLIMFSAKNHNTQIKVSGWREVSLGNNNCKLFVNGSERLCRFHYGRSFTSVQANNLYDWHSNIIPSDYRPQNMVTGSFNYLGTLIISSGGSVSGMFVNAYSGSSRTYNASAIWKY